MRSCGQTPFASSSARPCPPADSLRRFELPRLRMPRPAILPFVTDARLRTMPEARIVEHLVFHGWERAHRDADLQGPRRIAVEALARWRELGLPATRDADGSLRYDPAEVFLCMRWAGRKAGDPFWRPHHVAIERARLFSFHPPGTPRDTPPPIAALPSRRFTVTVERRFHPRYLAANARVRLPLPVEDAAARDVEVTLLPLDAPGEVRVAPGHAELRLAAAPTATVTLGARSSFIAAPYTPPREVPLLTPSERELYLRHGEELVQVTPAIVALTEDLVRGIEEPMVRVRRFFDYLLDRLDFGPFPYEWLDAREPLIVPREIGWFDCRLAAAMLVAMCRVAGIPARRASGYLIYPECAGYHWWIEVWIDDAGWVPVDTWVGELSASGHDVPWRSTLFGALDYRMKSEVLPRVFNRSPGVVLPPVWRILERDVDGATEIAVVDIATNDNVWADTISIEMGEDVPG